MSNLASNGASLGHPYKRLGMVIAAANVVSDRLYQLTDAAESSSSDAACPWMCGKPGLYGGMRMGAIVVQDEDEPPAAAACGARSDPRISALRRRIAT
jgi:hypothetical protein